VAGLGATASSTIRAAAIHRLGWSENISQQSNQQPKSKQRRLPSISTWLNPKQKGSSKVCHSTCHPKS